MKSETITDKAANRQGRATSDFDTQPYEEETPSHVTDKEPTKLVVPFGSEIDVVPLDAIDYIESAKRKVMIHAGGQVLQMYSTMRDMEARLSGNFMRCHNSFFVNMGHVVSARPGFLTLDSGAMVPVSKRYAKAVRECLGNAGRG